MWLVLPKFLKGKKQLQFWIQAGCKSDNLTNGAYKKYCYDDPLNEEGKKTNAMPLRGVRNGPLDEWYEYIN